MLGYQSQVDVGRAGMNVHLEQQKHARHSIKIPMHICIYWLALLRWEGKMMQMHCIHMMPLD